MIAVTIQPVVRLILTAIAAGLGAAATQIDNETLRIVAAILVPTLAAIGIVPPQVPTKTVIDRDGEGGYSAVDVLLIVFLALLCVVVLLALLGRL